MTIFVKLTHPTFVGIFYRNRSHSDENCKKYCKIPFTLFSKIWCFSDRAS